tara:strand:- start:1058 stop:1276 length:219 start_codon:yes stop_codon:yes gene_type:complete
MFTLLFGFMALVALAYAAGGILCLYVAWRSWMGHGRTVGAPGIVLLMAAAPCCFFFAWFLATEIAAQWAGGL